MQPIIIGIDPGTTSAFAAVDFSCKIVEIKSVRNYSFSSMISDVYKVGLPLIIGTDKKDVPSFIKDFSQKTGAKVITPRYDMKKGEKKAKVKRYGMLGDVSNAHETDALASAIYAYEQYRPLIEKINMFLKKNKKQELKEELITLLIDDSGISIKRAAEILEQSEKSKPKIEIRKPRPPTARKILSKEQRKILYLINQNIKLKQKIRGFKKKLKKEQNKTVDLDKKTKKMLSFKEKRILFFEQEIKKKDQGLQSLKHKINQLLDLISQIEYKQKMIKAKNLGKDFPKSKIKKGDVLYVENPSVISKETLQYLKDKDVEVIVYENKPSSELKREFILIDRNDLRIIEIENFAFTDKKELDQILKKHDKKYGKDFLKNIIEEYRRKRI